jgi:hypothetical protein
MHNPRPSPSTTDGPQSHPHPKDRNYDELKYAQTYAPAPAQVPVAVPVTDRLSRFFRTDDSSFWTGMLIGGVATFLLTSDTVKRAVVTSFAKVTEVAKKEVAETKEETTPEKKVKK